MLRIYPAIEGKSLFGKEPIPMLASLLFLIDSPEEKSRFEQLYHKYERLMFYVAKKRLGDDFLAEEAVNEAFIRIIKHFDKIEEIMEKLRGSNC